MAYKKALTLQIYKTSCFARGKGGEFRVRAWDETLFVKENEPMQRWADGLGLINEG